MTSYWVVALDDSTHSELIDSAWPYDPLHGTIAIGWNDLGCISDVADKDGLRSRTVQTYGDRANKVSITQDTNALWTYLRRMEPEDAVIARRGTRRIVGIGTVTGCPFYDETQGRERAAWPEPPRRTVVVELPAGTLADSGTQVGDQLLVTCAEPRV